MNKIEINRPTLLLDVEKCQRNIQKMVNKSMKHQLDLRPHFKTHQSAEIGQWLREAGVEKCTVSSVKMASYFATHGWKDILVAFPVNTLEAAAINQLGHEIKLQVLVYDASSLDMLAAKTDAPIGIKIELDLGSNRSGLRTNQHEVLDGLLQKIATIPNFHFTGFYSHPGHTYTAKSAQEVIDIYDNIIQQLEMLKASYGHAHGFRITIGDTPGCTISEDFGPIDEISPGNFVFYDAMQVNIGSCSYDDIAVVMACPVVGKNPDRNELLIHGGAVHFSKEVLRDADGTTHFGKLAIPVENGWHGFLMDNYLKSISQEHGLVHCMDDLFRHTNIGDILYIYPAHSCLTANLMKSYLTTEGIMMDGEMAFMP